MKSNNRLSFPTGKQFARILADDHEWEVITDTRLNVLVSERGDRGSIPVSVTERVYKRLLKTIPAGKSVKIYDLHTHPEQNLQLPMDKRNLMYPSTSDIGYVIQNARWNTDKKYTIVGCGQITKYGIFIMQFKGEIKKPNVKYENDMMEKHEEHKNIARNVYDERFNTSKIPRQEWTKDANTRAMAVAKEGYKSFEKENPEFKHKIVRKTHRFSMTRRR